ncbi:histidine phosphatase family protein [Nocardia cyriacigeorgica]|uniref:Histidine phosphatase family protein n=1 Tax=Nocardia cyriacigeorgica TaxID=135487 RepID=A0A6P1D8E5_9NOCA|nr:histidine phosphatase family protein [Nocardia cyriacigeorgica]NEW45899.1 histidine phosphatase family protein [Nocardia cyriacigeorgica]NEW52479.1 histidine phosphatase family protein [Nocardia cyriacigeorgica]NEW56728.1 histidine phosphatase family protein [Nocardia cyriacigeorgica]
MPGVLRLDLIGHGVTEAMRRARFPDDEPLTESGRNALEPYRPPAEARVLIAPERRAVGTAQQLGLSGSTEPALRDLDAGRWRGRELAALSPDEAKAWLTDPGFRGHGGDSISDVIDRVGSWLGVVADSGRSTVAITHPAVIRAALLVALDAPAASFWRLDVPPGQAVRLHHRGAWTVRFGR